MRQDGMLKDLSGITSIEEVNRVLFEGESAEEAVRKLMMRDRKMESSFRPEDLPECWRTGSSR